MSVHSTVDRETFQWVKLEVDSTLTEARKQLKQYADASDKEALLSLTNNLHQVVGSLQMLELTSLSTLVMETELLIDDYVQDSSEISTKAVLALSKDSIATILSTLDKIDNGLPENPIEIVELINQIRAARGLDAVEISALFSPNVEVFPEVTNKKPLVDADYKARAKALRVHFQSNLLKWLRDGDNLATERLGIISDKLYEMSTFGAVARLWWVTSAYIDYVKNHELKSRHVHGRIFRKVDDLLRKLEQQGESALVRDPGDELIKVMLFYTGVGTSRTERMDEVAKAFSLNEFFPALDRTDITSINYKELSQDIVDFNKSYDLPVGKVRQLTAQYFDDVENGEGVLDELIEHTKVAEEKFEKADLPVLSPIVDQVGELIRGLRSGKIQPDEDNGFHLAAAVLFVENTLTHVDSLDEYWVQTGELKLSALKAINSHQEITSEMDGSQLSGSERKALLEVVSTEVEQSLSDIELKLEAFSKDSKNGELIAGIDGNIRQVRGALQVLGEHKIGLLLQMTEDQFTSLESGESAATPALIEALAIAVGTMEDYVKGLQSGRAGMDEMLDRSITDLEVSIGKKVSRGDVEELLGESSDSLFSWLGDQSDFALFTNLKSHLRDLLTLSKKTGLNNVEELVKEQTRLVDLISEEPAFLTENITNNLQNNMGNIVSEIIELYGTEETEEEIQSEAEFLEKKTALKADDGPKFHDEMDVEELDDDLKQETEVEGVTATQLGKQHAATNKISAEDVDESILEIFIEESTEVLIEAKSLYKACEEDNNDRDSIRELRRAFHTLKGSSRMVGLNDIGEVAWFTESLFNFVLDTGKPLTKPVLEFAYDAIEEFDKHLAEEYKNQHLVDVAAWGARTEATSVEESSDDDIQDQEDIVDLEENIESVTLEIDSEEEQTIEIHLESDDLLDENQDDEVLLDLSLDTGDTGLPTDESATNEDIDSEILEFTADNDESIEFEEVDQVSGEKDEFFEATTASFSVIDDEEMRQVFVKEAKANIDNIEKNLKREPIEIGEDDPLSISIHTLLGNSRTLGLNSIASAFEEAEKICLCKAESHQAFTAEEVISFNELVVLTKACIESESNQEPYFIVDDHSWNAVAEKLEVLADSAKQHQFDIEQNNIDGLEDESSEQQELASSPVDDEASSRVAAVFEGLEPIDELMADEQLVESSTDGLNGIDLDQISLEEKTDKEIEVSEPLLDASEKSFVAEDISDELEIDELTFDSSELAYSFSDKQTEEEHQQHDGLAQDEDNIEIEDVLLELDDLDLDEDLGTALSDDDDLELAEAENAQVADSQAETIEKDQGSLEATSSSSISSNDREVEFEGEQIDEELQEIFVEELKGIHHDFDDEVAKLVDLASTPEAMANIMRHLHTIKGSALMAEANSLGELTHQTESFLEGNFIRDSDGLREVRETLELYTETLQEAGDAYEDKRSYKIPSELLTRLGLATEQTVDLKEIEQSIQSAEVVEVEEGEHDLSSFDIDHTLTKIATDVQNIHAHWISASKWDAVKLDYLNQNAELNELLEVAEELKPLSGFVSFTDDFVNKLSFDDGDDHESVKSLLEEVYDVINSNARTIISGNAAESTADLETQMNAIMAEKAVFEEESIESELEGDALGSEAKEETIDIDIPVEDAEADQVAVSSQEETVQENKDVQIKDELKQKEAEIFVPGSVEVDEQEQKNTERQEKAAKARAAALRIRTETLDSLTNFVGDASMNRSQMREDVLSVKTVVDDLYNNVTRFSQQLRELEMEADSKITARSNETLSKDRGEEFDPLEMDRYTKLQQLSRGLTENLDELSNIQTSLSSFVYRAETSLQKQDRLNRELQDEIMQVRLVTFGGVGPQLRQVVRRTSREVGKKVDLEIVGAEVKLDKTILDGIIPALEHMLRNGVDHGIEMPSDRVAKGKSETGKIIVECRQVAREIIVSVKDDGAGLDLDKIRKKAVKENMLSEGETIKPEDIMVYLTQSGFSTAEKLTKISGRGVGMDVVQDSLRRMSGSISYEPDNTQPGSCFTIKLPISLAVSSAMFVESAGVQYAISARSIDRIVNEEAEELRELLKGDKPILKVGDDFYALIDLADYLGYETRIGNAEEKLPVVLVTAGVQNIAVIVDELLDTQEIVVKGLGGHLGRIPIFGGATIRADGSVVLLVDMVGISYYESQISLPETHGDDATSIPDIMVVDDSLTVRKSAERDISAMGINSVLAKDGLDAQEQLKAGFVPDMILLDIEMPRMDGFELLEWVKSEDDLKHIPVVMISSRATEKHIDKAKELGCTAFLGKPYLLESLVATFNQHLKLESPIELDKK